MKQGVMPPHCSIDGEPVLSIVIPTLNEAGRLHQCIADLQKGRPDMAYEIIVADGGSDDDTLGEARRRVNCRSELGKRPGKPRCLSM